MNAIVTVVGQDKGRHHRRRLRPAGLSTMSSPGHLPDDPQGSFTMVMAVDVGAAKVSVGERGTCWSSWGEDEISIRIQREIFDAIASDFRGSARPPL